MHYKSWLKNEMYTETYCVHFLYKNVNLRTKSKNDFTWEMHSELYPTYSGGQQKNCWGESTYNVYFTDNNVEELFFPWCLRSWTQMGSIIFFTLSQRNPTGNSSNSTDTRALKLHEEECRPSVKVEETNLCIRKERNIVLKTEENTMQH